MEMTGVLMAGLGAVAIVGCVFVLIAVALIWLTYDAAKAADPDKQTMKPGFVWLCLIPLFNLYWNFVAFPAVSDSLAATARGKGKDVGDAGRSVGMAFCCLAILAFLLGVINQLTRNSLEGLELIAYVIVFILHIVYVVKVRKAKAVINS
ncbi:MAG: hypothetical protein CMJ40_01695 [Phycisphaerae bacterium]|nr:hypothetical protein [Phycisphaerae bacterium]